MTEPRPLWELVDKWKKEAKEEPSIWSEIHAKQLAGQLRSWDEQIRDGIESRKTQTSIDPLYTMGTNQAVSDVLQHILGVPSK